MYDARELFDFLLSPFILQPILDFAFSSACHSCRQGAEFLRLLLWNMFIAEPADAVQDVMEINFGFQITSIAGMTTEQFAKIQDPKLSEAEDGEQSNPQPVDYHPIETPNPHPAEPKEEEEKKEKATGEFETMKQEENLKMALLQGARKIYDKNSQEDLNSLLSQQIVSFFVKFESLFKQEGLKVINRVKLYELLQTMVLLDNETINEGLSQRGFVEQLMNDYERFDSNSNVLNSLNKVIIVISCQNSS